MVCQTFLSTRFHYQRRQRLNLQIKFPRQLVYLLTRQHVNQLANQISSSTRQLVNSSTYKL